MKAAGDKTIPGFYVYVVTRTIGRGFSAPDDPSAKMGLIGRLVFGKADIFVDAEYAIFGQHVGYAFVEFRNFVDQSVDKRLELAVCRIKLVFMRLEPFATVVSFQSFQTF